MEKKGKSNPLEGDSDFIFIASHPNYKLVCV